MKMKGRLLSFVVVVAFMFCLAPQMFSDKETAATNIVDISKSHNVYMTDVSGTTYGWKVLCAIRISHPKFGDAVEKLWENSGIPRSERDKYYLANVKEVRGTDWGILLVGENYLTVIADIIKH